MPLAESEKQELRALGFEQDPKQLTQKELLEEILCELRAIRKNTKVTSIEISSLKFHIIKR